MQRLAGYRVIGSLRVAVAALAEAAASSGTFVSESDPTVSLTLEEAADGSITGTLRDAMYSLPVQAWRDGAGLAGPIATAGEPLPFTAAITGEQRVLRIGPEGVANVTSLRRVAGAASHPASATAGEQRVTAAGAADSPETPGAVGRHVVINGQALNHGDLAGIEQQYRLRIPDADDWYVPVLGARGVRGGPTLGFIMPGLPLGGPLAADASGDGTSVFINDRALHPYDLNALQQLVSSVVSYGD